MRIHVLMAVSIFPVACATTSSDRTTVPARPGFPIYDGTVTIDPAAQTLGATWRIDFVPDSTSADSVALLLNRGLLVSSLRGTGVAGYTQREADGWNRVVVRFADDVRAGQATTLELAYAGRPAFSEDGINGISPSWVELGLDAAWHPVFAKYDQNVAGGFTLRAPGNWQVVGSGATVRGRDGTVLTNRIPLIDLAFVAAPSLRVSRAAAATVYHANADSATITRVLETTTACAQYLNQRYGARETLPPIKIVLAPRAGPGYARTNYIVITDVSKLPPDALSRFLCHELAHFWSTGANSSGPENWLNEAFAEFVAVRYVRDVHGREPFLKIIEQFRAISEKQPAVWTPAATARPTGMVSYRKAPYLLHLLEERVGSDVMDRILARRMSERVVRTQDLLSVIAQTAGQAHADWFAAQLGK